jgi:K+-transporting ATPase KdpF subunit
LLADTAQIRENVCLLVYNIFTCGSEIFPSLCFPRDHDDWRHNNPVQEVFYGCHVVGTCPVAVAGAGFGGARYRIAKKGGVKMSIEYIVGGVVCTALVVYLVYVLLNAERF